jgi:hypothetical protein
MNTTYQPAYLRAAHPLVKCYVKSVSYDFGTYTARIVVGTEASAPDMAGCIRLVERITGTSPVPEVIEVVTPLGKWVICYRRSSGVWRAA